MRTCCHCPELERSRSVHTAVCMSFFLRRLLLLDLYLQNIFFTDPFHRARRQYRGVLCKYQRESAVNFASLTWPFDSIFLFACAFQFRFECIFSACISAFQFEKRDFSLFRINRTVASSVRLIIHTVFHILYSPARSTVSTETRFCSSFHAKYSSK